MPPLLLVMIGGALGAGCRYATGALALRSLGPALPWGTGIVNLVGGLLMGLLAGALARHGGTHGEGVRLFLGVGVLGGFTTFSAFSLELTTMLMRGDGALALGYALVSVIGAVAMVYAGLLLMRGFA